METVPCSLTNVSLSERKMIICVDHNYENCFVSMKN